MDNNETQPTGFTGPQPGAPANQPVNPNPPVTPPGQTAPQPVTNNPVNTSNTNKKGLLVGCVLGVVVIILVVILFVFFFKGGGKTVSCTIKEDVLGMNIEGETNINVKDGEIIGGTESINVDLKSMSETYKKYEQELVDGIIEHYENYCEEQCTFSKDYVEGDYLKLTMQYEGEGVDSVVYTYGIEDSSAQEIADMIQKSMEETDGVTCKQH